MDERLCACTIAFSIFLRLFAIVFRSVVDVPYHAGDLPPLFSSHGQAYMAVLSGRFRIPEVLGRTIVIHSGPDDFTPQPAGNSGKKIACGVIRKV